MNLYNLHKTPNVLRGISEASELVPNTIYWNFIYGAEHTEKRLIRISKNTRYSFRYALVAKQAFPLGEKAIARSPQFSYDYACCILHTRFLLGEKTIAKNRQYSILYAKNVIKGRFLLGEENLKGSSSCWKEYKKLFKFEEG